MINKVTVRTSLYNLMGKVNAPGGTADDLDRYIQEAFNYAWQYYKWNYSITSAAITIDGSGNAYLPDDFDPSLYHEVAGVTEVPLADAIASTSGVYAITWDDAAGKYKTVPATAFTIVYQKTPPTLSDSVNVPFPSPQVIALGASIYAKSAANPSSADTSQEWDMFHDELDRLVARAYTNGTTHKAKNRYDLFGIGTGES